MDRGARSIGRVVIPIDRVANLQVGTQQWEIRLACAGRERVGAVGEFVSAHCHGIVSSHVHELKQRAAVIHVAGGRRAHCVPAVQDEDRILAGAVISLDHRHEFGQAASVRHAYLIQIPCLFRIVESFLGVDIALQIVGVENG